MNYREANPPFYRKVALNGRPVCDTEPNRQKRTDAEAEKTNVDALTLQMRHHVTDVYVPLVASDFALNLRRNNFASAWRAGAGLSSARRPDLPFGNCWLSGLVSNVHVLDRGAERPVDVLVTDEEGTRHAFIELFVEGRSAGYHPLPSIDSDQDGRVMSLTHQEGHLVLRRKFGTSLSFDFTAPAVEIVTTDATGTKEIHRYYRAVRARHPRGGYLQYHFESANSGLVPDEISFVQKRMRVRRNAQGYVEQIVDPRGFEWGYEYRPSSLPGGAPLLVHLHRPLLRGSASQTTYDYHEASGPNERQDAAVSLIADPLGHTYRFRYSPAASGELRSLRLSEVDLPGDSGTTKFLPYVKRAEPGQAPSVRMTFVTDAVGNGVLYEFSHLQTATLTGLPWRRTGSGESANDVTLGGWLRQDITYFQGNRHHFDEQSGKFRAHLFTRQLLSERYEFDTASGLALARAFDTERNATSFAYGDPLRRPHLDGVLPADFTDPFALRCRDVTETVNPLGGVRRLEYHPTNRVIVRREDELGHITVWKVDEVTGFDFSKSIYADAKDEGNNVPHARTEWEFKHPDFPGFVTRKVVHKTNSEAESPDWEVDIVRVYEADESGNIACETADPDGRRFVWRYTYNEHNAKLSTFYPDNYFIQFRYDSLNRLDRVYRPHRAVKKSWFDARGNRTRELEPNGDLTITAFDVMARVARKTVATGKVDERKTTVTVFRYNAVNSKTYESVTGSAEKIYRFDGAQRVRSIVEGRNKVTHYRYSANGCSNLFEKTSYKCSRYYTNFLKQWFCHYDGMQNLLRKSSAPFRWYTFFLPPQTLTIYDVAGNKVEHREGRSVTRFEYNPLHQLVMTRESSGRWTRTLRTSTGLEYGTADSTGARNEKKFDSSGYEA